jgi:hypothetical protein
MTTTASRPGAKPRAAIAARTLRTDRWWVPPLGIAAILLFFIAYATVRIFMAKWYFVPEHNYLTPLYSPCVAENCVPGSSHFGTWLPALPFFIPLGIIAFPIVAGFRVTCYYWYLAFAVLLINFYDAALGFKGTDGGFGIGLGTVIIWVNVLALAGYTLSCHVCRHITGGRLKHFSKHPLRYKFWTFVSKLNAKHGTYAMTSLFTVILTDAYIMALSAGWFSDLRFIN